jgi:ectoine hydroxylase-related dioxygenase (phytanoyl-CoA dioxygenase family)
MPIRAMTDEQRLFFETNGYLVVSDALSAVELEDVRAASGQAEAIWRNDTSRLGMRNENLSQVQAPIEYDDVFLDLMEHPRVFPLIREALGDDISMIDNDLFISPLRTKSHARWHHDVGMPGIHHPRSTLMVKAFFLLTDVADDGGCTLFLPGSHRFPADFALPKATNPTDMPGHVKMAWPAGTVYFFNGRLYHAASDNNSDQERRALIYNYGHFWMKPWQGYEPSARLQEHASTALRRQLLGVGDAYGTYLKDDG